MNLASKVALITGASSGIGAATAIHLAELGVFLCLSGRNEDRLNETKQKCVEKGLKDDQILCTKAEMTVENDLKMLVEKTKEKFGKLNILVNNAGRGGKGSNIDGSIELYDEIMAVNMRAVLVLTKLCIPHLVETQGVIINVSSICGMKPVHFWLYYSLSKAALDQFTKCMALELAPKKVRVNSVNPALVRTEFFANEGRTPEEIETLIERTKTYPLGRIAEPEEVAKAIAFLASDNSAFTTGQLLCVDGGRQLS